MTRLAHPNPDFTPALILFGNDQTGRPHAGWFTSEELAVAERASGSLGYVALRVTNEEEYVFARLLPRGEIGCDRQVHVLPLSPELVETLRALTLGDVSRPARRMAASHQRRHLLPRYRKPSLRQRA
jgi:hypothetical protein